MYGTCFARSEAVIFSDRALVRTARSSKKLVRNPNFRNERMI